MDNPVQPQITASAIRPDMSEEEIKKQLFVLLGQSFGQQTQQIEALRQQAEAEKKRQEEIGALGRLDLRPFAQAAAGYGATNVAIPSGAPVDRTALLSKLQSAVSEAQQGLTKDQVNTLRAMLTEKQASKAGAQAAISEKNQQIRMFNTAQANYLKPANDYIKGAGTYNFVRQEIATGQPSRINRALSQYARIMGQTGVLTDQDIRMQMPPSALAALDRAYTFVSGNPDADLPAGIVQDLLGTLDQGHKASQQAFQKKVDLVHNTYMMSPYVGLPGLENLYEQASKAITSVDGAPKEAKTSLPSAAAVQAEIEKRNAAKRGK